MDYAVCNMVVGAMRNGSSFICRSRYCFRIGRCNHAYRHASAHRGDSSPWFRRGRNRSVVDLLSEVAPCCPHVRDAEELPRSSIRRRSRRGWRSWRRSSASWGSSLITARKKPRRCTRHAMRKRIRANVRSWMRSLRSSRYTEVVPPRLRMQAAPLPAQSLKVKPRVPRQSPEIAPCGVTLNKKAPQQPHAQPSHATPSGAFFRSSSPTYHHSLIAPPSASVR